MSKEITIEDVRKWKAELEKKNIKSRGVTFNLPQGHIGNGIYRIADNCWTNEAGWNQYLEALLKAGEKYAD